MADHRDLHSDAEKVQRFGWDAGLLVTKDDDRSSSRRRKTGQPDRLLGELDADDRAANLALPL